MEVFTLLHIPWKQRHVTQKVMLLIYLKGSVEFSPWTGPNGSGIDWAQIHTGRITNVLVFVAQFWCLGVFNWSATRWGEETPHTKYFRTISSIRGSESWTQREIKNYKGSLSDHEFLLRLTLWSNTCGRQPFHNTGGRDTFQYYTCLWDWCGNADGWQPVPTCFTTQTHHFPEELGTGPTVTSPQPKLKEGMSAGDNVRVCIGGWVGGIQCHNVGRFRWWEKKGLSRKQAGYCIM